MSIRIGSISAALLVVVSAVGTPHHLQAQALAGRVAAAPSGNLQFAFAARDGVCGDGKQWLATGDGTFRGSFSGSFSTVVTSIQGGDSNSNGPSCLPGPVRVTLVRADRTIVNIRAQAGPLTPEAGVHNLGIVPAREASMYLLSLARTLDGKPGQQAILPAVLADGAEPGTALLALARDGTRPSDTRRSAISWLARDAAGVSIDDVMATLTDLARSTDQTRTIRSAALSSLRRASLVEGVPALMRLASQRTDMWLAERAVSGLGSSGDPRARTMLRSIVTGRDAADGVRAGAIKALSRSYATAVDDALLRQAFGTTTGSKSQDAIISALASRGGAENATWLLTVAEGSSYPSTKRRRAISHAVRAGVSAAELVRLYDRVEERTLRDATLSALGGMESQVATDKLLDVARRDTEPRLRRKAIAMLSRSDDPAVKTALREMVTK